MAYLVGLAQPICKLQMKYVGMYMPSYLVEVSSTYTAHAELRTTHSEQGLLLSQSRLYFFLNLLSLMGTLLIEVLPYFLFTIIQNFCSMSSSKQG